MYESIGARIAARERASARKSLALSILTLGAALVIGMALRRRWQQQSNASKKSVPEFV